MKNLLFILFFLIVVISCKVTSITSDIYLKTEIESYDLLNKDTLVDVGCADGTHAAYISHFYPSLYFILEDINAKKNNQIDKQYNKFHKSSLYIKERYRVVLGTPDTIPLSSQKYNNLLCRKTLHEFTNPTKMIREMNRILGIGGKLIVVEGEPLRENDKDPYCGKLLWPKQTIIDALENEGFSFVKSADIPMKKNRKLIVLIFEKSSQSI